VVLAVVALLATSCTGRTVLEETTPTRKAAQSSLAGKVKKIGHIPRDKSCVVWFVKPSESGDLASVSFARGSFSEPAVGEDLICARVEDAVKELLKGPSTQEAGEGIGSEVPKGTVFISVSRDKATGGIVLNLSRRFVTGGGIDSFQARMKQLSLTCRKAADGEKVYLNVEGQRLERATGEGIEVEQPIN
jgi:spore germination protein GerM